MSVFRNRFLEILDEEDFERKGPSEFNAEMEADALAGATENPEDLDAMGASPEARNALDPDEINDETVRDVVGKISDFEDWLQNVDGDCLKKDLNVIDNEGSKYEGISKSSEAPISRAAESLAKLKSELTKFYTNKKQVQEPTEQAPQQPQF